MEYYSAIKRNEIELFVVRWMALESVIQSEVMGPLAPPSWPKEELHSLGLPWRGGSSERGDSKGGSSFSFLDCLLKELRDNRGRRN